MKKRLCIPLVLLMACMLFGFAAAEEMVTLESGLPELLYYKCTLPDGRLLLSGVGTVPGGDFPAALLRCLNPDRTVSWEWADSGWARAGRAAVIRAGTVAVVLDHHTDGCAVRFFTQDGKPTGKELAIPDRYSEIWEMAPSFMMMLDKDSDSYHTDLLDWDGRLIIGYDGVGMPGSFGFPVQDADELTLWGQADNYHVAMVKMDALTGEALWNTVVDFQVPGMDRAWPVDAVKTGDGGYAGWMEETRSPLNDEKYQVLVKLDTEGRVLWGKWKEFERETVCGIKAYNGRIVVFCVPEGTDRNQMDTPKIFHWFDEGGTDLGTTELKIAPDKFPLVHRCLESDPEAVPLFTLNMPMFAMPDGLWVLADCAAGNRDGGYSSGEAEIVLIRIPEP